MTNPTTQRRLMALLTGAIYAIANGLFPVINTIMEQTNRTWCQRANYANRFSRIIMHLLALTARIRPETLSRNPTFTTAPQPPAQPAQATQPKRPGPSRAPGSLSSAPLRMLSALQVARQLAKLLRQLEQLVAELRTALPDKILCNITRARAIAGCNALPPPPHPTWERAG